MIHDIDVCGFDINEAAINSLREDLPRGGWSVCSYDKYVPSEEIDLLMWLGMEIPEAVPAFVRLVEVVRPSIVLLEYATGFSKGEVSLGAIAGQIVGDYELIGVNQTSFGFAQRFPFEFASRTFVIYREVDNASTS